ncbi:MAG: DUF5011 domain-containing protein [Bacteroidales bacterium]|nr:DUF5011 domain-containing protein [Bacteroidales bacterium]
MKTINYLSGLFLISIIILISACNKDKTDPVITILGDNPETICVGQTYEDAGATALDNEDGDLTDKIETTINVDNSQPGTGHVTYSVTDNAGNTGTASRTVEVIYCK